MRRWIVGIDEVGRGALAGPVVVAAAALPVGFRFGNHGLGKLKDSKKLSREQREAWFAYCLEKKIRYSLARVYPRQIEKRNISKAANMAAERAFGRLAKTILLGSEPNVFLDGGLFLGNSEQSKNARTIIKGDEKINVIKLASIIAKVHRDNIMRRLAKRHSRYGFEIHKGYGTKVHLAALKKFGPTAVHRLTFVS
jgi:ribonuclease HII